MHGSVGLCMHGSVAVRASDKCDGIVTSAISKSTNQIRPSLSKRTLPGDGPSEGG